MFKTVLRCAAPAMIVAMLVLVPFLGKAFTIDDTLFLYLARHALTDPLHPAAFDMYWTSQCGCGARRSRAVR
jgi:hypothetical protein